jgi:imidazolonepropionase
MVRQSQDTPTQETVLLRGARQLLTLRGAEGPRRGAALGELGVIPDGAVLIRAGKVLEAGPSRRVENLSVARRAREINAAGRVVMPGFVDSRAQLVGPPPVLNYANEAEFRRVCNELSALPSRRLEARAQFVLAGMTRHGTTTVAAVTHPAPGLASELKMARVLAGLHGHPLDVITTYFGAQCIPPEFAGNPAAFVETLCTGLMPAISRRKLARFAEVNCGAFELAAARRYLECARSMRFGLSVRTGACAGAVRLAQEMDAASVALDDIAASEIGSLAQSRTIVLLAPASLFHRRVQGYPPARALIDAGAAIALASGFGLEQGPTYNMQMVMSLASLEMGMSPAEAIAAATINGAHALGRAEQCGSLEPGKQADLVLLNVQDYREMADYFGINHVHMVLKNGGIVYQEGEVTGWPGK